MGVCGHFVPKLCTPSRRGLARPLSRTGSRGHGPPARPHARRPALSLDEKPVDDRLSCGSACACVRVPVLDVARNQGPPGAGHVDVQGLSLVDERRAKPVDRLAVLVRDRGRIPFEEGSVSPGWPRRCIETAFWAGLRGGRVRERPDCSHGGDVSQRHRHRPCSTGTLVPVTGMEEAVANLGRHGVILVKQWTQDGWDHEGIVESAMAAVVVVWHLGYR